MDVLLVFAGTLLLAVLVSGLAERSILSTAVLFLLAGFLFEQEILGVITVRAESPTVRLLAELALFSVLFTDGMRVGLRDLVSAWHLPGRALLGGMPLTLLGTAALARYLLGLPWLSALLLGAALSPTDPVLAAAIIGRERVPHRLRRLLNVESGVNDGLALPVVLLLLAVVTARELHPGQLVGEAAGGVALGVAVPWLAVRLEASRFFSAATAYEPLNAFAIGVLVLALASVTHQNEFLAAFAAGVTIATAGPQVRDSFHRFGELVADVLKFAALLLFGALISPELLRTMSWEGYLFAVLALVAVRPLAMNVALLGSSLHWPERLAASWFGPKGFASVVYGLLILKSGWQDGERLFHLIALVVAGSIVAHSSTDVLVARWFQRAETDRAEGSREGGQPP